jgi:hypothetical protein
MSTALSTTTTYGKGAVIGRTRKEALAKLHTEQRAGRIHSAGDLHLITKGSRAGQYAIPVYLIVAPRPQRHRAPSWIAPALTLAVLAAALAWLLTALTATALALFLGAALLAFLGRLKFAHGRPARGATVTTTVTFH